MRNARRISFLLLMAFGLLSVPWFQGCDYSKGKMKFNPLDVGAPDSSTDLTGKADDSEDAKDTTDGEAIVPPYYAFAFVRENSAISESYDIYWGATQGGSWAVPLTALTGNSGSGTIAPLLRSLAFSPDGTKMIFPAQIANKFNLYVLDVEEAKGTTVTSLKPWGALAAAPIFSLPAWHGDGKKVEIAGVNDGASGCALRRTDADGANVQTLFESPQSQKCSDPGDPSTCQMSADEFYMGIAFSPVKDPSSPSFEKMVLAIGKTQAPDESLDLWIRKADDPANSGANLTQTADTGEFEPAFSPDGKRLAFTLVKKKNTSDVELQVGACDLAIENGSDVATAKLANCAQLTSTAESNSSPSWSCDGRKIFFSRYDEASKKSRIYWMNPDGTEQQPLLDGANNDGAPVASPVCPKG